MNMTKRELERHTKKIEKEIKRMNKFYDEYQLEENKDTIRNFKYYSGFDNKRKRKVRSITLSYKNDKFITEIQRMAKSEGNFISKDIIINLALFNLMEETQKIGFICFSDWLNNYTK